ncbi:MAG TPA: DUF952 domain-containing protein [Actinomycetes bacterium]
MTGTTVPVYHLTSRGEWDAALAEGCYRRSTRGKSLVDVGFIHGSPAGQLAEVAELVYEGCEDELVALVMDMRRLEAAGLPLRLEDGGNGTYYPHIYAPLPCHLVDDVRPAWFDGQGRFVFDG